MVAHIPMPTQPTPTEECTKLEDYLQTMDGLKQLDSMIRKGWSLEQIARFYGISTDTLYVISVKHPVIRQTFGRSEKTLLGIMERSLYNRGLPQVYRETTVTYTATNQVEKIVRKTKEIPADTSAMKFYLINRDPDNWKERLEADTSTSTKPVVIVDTITARAKEKDRMMKQLEAEFNGRRKQSTDGTIDGSK